MKLEGKPLSITPRMILNRCIGEHAKRGLGLIGAKRWAGIGA
jgi:hypothetical protein